MSEGNTYNLLKSSASYGDNTGKGFDNLGG